MTICLIVIDAQESFRHRPYFTKLELMPYLAAQNALIEGCAAAGVPIVRILHVDSPAAADNPFAVESGHVRAPDGRPLSAADIKVRTATVLDGRFAKVCSARQALDRLGVASAH